MHFTISLSCLQPTHLTRRCCNDSWNPLLRSMATEEKGPAKGLEPGTYTLLRSFSHKLPVPAASPSSPIAFCTGRRCAAIQRPLRTYTSRLVLCDAPVQRAMGDEGFAAGTSSSVIECRSRVQAQSLVLFPLLPFFWAVFPGIITALATPAHTNFLHKHGETEAVGIVHHSLAGSCYMPVTRWANYHHITQYQPRGIGPKQSLDSSTPATGT